MNAYRPILHYVHSARFYLLHDGSSRLAQGRADHLHRRLARAAARRVCDLCSANAQDIHEIDTWMLSLVKHKQNLKPVGSALTQWNVGHLLAGVEKAVFRRLGEDVLRRAHYHRRHQWRRA